MINSKNNKMVNNNFDILINIPKKFLDSFLD